MWIKAQKHLRDKRTELCKELKWLSYGDISTMKTFKQCVLHFRNLTKWRSQSFEFIIQNTSSSSRKEKEDKRRRRRRRRND
jgi:hypothetical protein